MALRHDPGVLRVRLDGPAQGRILRVMSQQGIPEELARRQQRQTDRARRAYLRHFYGTDGSDHSLYNLVIDTTVLSDEQAIEQIVELATRVPVPV